MRPFRKVIGQVKFFIVIVCYFIKWIEVEPFKIFKKNILSLANNIIKL